jgi:hypothetical protein
MFKPILNNSTIFSLTLIGIGTLILSILAKNPFIFILSICLIYFPIYIYDKESKKNTYKELDKQINKTDLKVGHVVIGEKKIWSDKI